MNQILDERLGHGSCVFVPPFQGLSSFLFANPGRCPGLVCCSPFGATECAGFMSHPAKYRPTHVSLVLSVLLATNDVGEMPHASERGPPFRQVLHQQSVSEVTQGDDPGRL